MYYYGGGSTCPYYSWNYNTGWGYGGYGGYGGYYNQNYGQGYAIILVLFILLVIVIGARWTTR